jgi:hypothetical protein
MVGSQSTTREHVGDVFADVVLTLGYGGFTLGHEERGDGGQRQFELDIVERGRKGGLERGTDEWLQSFPWEDDLAAFEGLFSFLGRQLQRGVGCVEAGEGMADRFGPAGGDG